MRSPGWLQAVPSSRTWCSLCPNTAAVQCFGRGVGSAAPIQHGQSTARQPWQSWLSVLSVPCSLTCCRLAQTSCSYSACQQTLIKLPDWSELLRFVFGSCKKRRRQFLNDFLVKLLHSRQYKLLCQVFNKSFICLSTFSVDNLIIGLMS